MADRFAGQVRKPTSSRRGWNLGAPNRHRAKLRYWQALPLGLLDIAGLACLFDVQQSRLAAARGWETRCHLARLPGIHPRIVDDR